MASGEPSLLPTASSSSASESTAAWNAMSSSTIETPDFADAAIARMPISSMPARRSSWVDQRLTAIEVSIALAGASSEAKTVATRASFAAGSADESARAPRSCVESPITRPASKSCSPVARPSLPPSPASASRAPARA